ncbi:MAG: DUF853 family protein, partial [Pseudomonadales bacterium]|nr:DUF853 family protein [Pseudomonadales bacterium]
LGVGEALVSVLDARGSPTPVEPTRIYPPHSRLGPLTDAERAEQLARSPLAGRYDQLLDRESAHELLAQRTQRDAAAAIDPEPGPPAGRGRQRETLLEATAKSALRAVGSQLGRQLVRGVLGSLLGGRRR